MVVWLLPFYQTWGAFSVYTTIIFKKNVQFSMLSSGFYCAKVELLITDIY